MADSRLTALSLCSGIGGIELGLSEWVRVLGYVERDAYAASVLLARMEDETLESAPIWCGDLQDFPASEFAGVDLITAGFPCQPFSQAGKREREQDKRHLWPQIAECIRVAEPWLVFLENVQLRAFREPFRDLRDMGFTVSNPCACTASELGAGHRRRRVFVLAHRDGAELRLQQGWRRGASGEEATKPANAASDAHDSRELQPGGSLSQERGRYCDPTRWSAEPGVARVVHGLPDRVDRERCLGNAVVPAQARLAFSRLLGGLT